MAKNKTKATKLPSKSAADAEERKLAAWMETQKEAKRKGKLTAAQIKKLEVLPGWKEFYEAE